MIINGINGTNAQMGQMGMNQAMDSYSRKILTQIADAQKQLQELSFNKDMTQEEKMMKRRELQQKISDLTVQLRQHQMEQRREKQQKESSFDDMIGEKQKTGAADTGVMISLSTSKEQIAGMEKVRTAQTEEGKEPSAKLYTSSGTLQGAKTGTSESKYYGQEILDEIDKYTSAGQICAIWSNGKETWLQGIEPGRNGGPVGDKKYFNLGSLNAVLEKNNQKKLSVVNNTVLFENNSYYKFTGKNGKEHSLLSLGGALHIGLFGNKTYDREAADYVDFWNGLSRKTPSGLSIKFSDEEIRSRLADAGIQNGFFTVTVGGRTATHFLSQGKSTAAVHSKEQYDERYNRMISGRFFKQFQAGQKVMVGGKEYVLGEDKKLDIEYGADIFDLHAQAPESMREA